MSEQNKRLYNLANPSDPYTLFAPSVSVAGGAVLLISGQYGAIALDENGRKDDEAESSPVLSGWQEWVKKHNMGPDWLYDNRTDVADALESVVIGSPAERIEFEARMKDKTREEYDAAKLQKLEDEQTSLNQIGQLAYSLARSLREMEPEELKGAFEMQ